MALKGALFQYDVEIVLTFCEEHGELKTDLSLKCWLICITIFSMVDNPNDPSQIG